MAKLKAVPELEGRIHDGYVPDIVPTDSAGFILPYVVVFSGVGSDIPEERDLTLLDDTGVLDWSTQTTCVGPTPSHCRKVVHTVRLALQNMSVRDGWLQADTETFRMSVPIIDSDVSPARFFLPPRWRLITT